MKCLHITIASLLLLSACGGSGSAEVSCPKQYWDGQVGLCKFDDWSVMNRETLRQRGVPDETIVALQADDAVSGQFPTVAVTQEVLLQPMSAEAYSQASVRAVSVYPSYELLDSTPVSIDGNSVDLHIFLAQPIADEPKRRYYQVSTVDEKSGYTVTAAAPVSIGDTLDQQIVAILQSFTLEDSETE